MCVCEFLSLLLQMQWIKFRNGELRMEMKMAL